MDKKIGEHFSVGEELLNDAEQKFKYNIALKAVVDKYFTLTEVFNQILNEKDFTEMGNRTIATFVEGKIFSSPGMPDLVYDLPEYTNRQSLPQYRPSHQSHHYLISELEFHSNWAWLMDVVEKIENLTDENNVFLYSVDLGRDYCIIKTNTLPTVPISNVSIPNNKILSTWLAVLQFLKQ